jgi:hypothetical protein
MREAEWVDCADPDPMLEFLWGSSKFSERKARLFAVAAARRSWHLIKNVRTRDALEAAERFADGLASWEEYAAAAHAAGFEAGSVYSDLAVFQAVNVAVITHNYTDDDLATNEVVRSDLAAQADLLRCLIGHPCRPLPVLPPSLLDWSGGLVRKLAEAAYEERLLPSGELDSARLAVLADALEEAGCTDSEILGHLRGPGPHTRGCWAVDAVLGMT